MDRELAGAAYRDAGLDPSRRADDLLARMSLDEKVAQLGCVWSVSLVEEDAFAPARAAERMPHGTGQITRIAGATGLRPDGLAAFANRIQRWLREETRLGIPALVHEESTAGFMARDADQFPQAIGLAASWDPERVRAAADVIRQQMLAVGARQTLAPVLDVARDPRWGRLEETYGEDPYLASRMGVAYVQGVQGDDLSRGVVATGKHFLGYGASEGGHNHKPAHIGPRELREVYARPFLAAIQEAGLASMMNAYNEVDGLPCGGSAEILDSLLRDELGFDGVVVADYFTTLLLIAAHRVAGDKAESAAMALAAGLDVELPALDCYAELPGWVRQGRFDESLVDRSVQRVLRQKFQLGLFEAPLVDESAAKAAFGRSEARVLARELAVRSLVLLKNEGDLLPLDPGVGCVAVIGPCADDPRLLQGDYHYPAHLEIIYQRREQDLGSVLPRADEGGFATGPYFPPSVTPLQGIRAAVSAEAKVLHAPGCDVLDPDASRIGEAVEAARAAEVAVVCVGSRSGLMPDSTSGEFRDACDLGLTGAQQELVEAVVGTGTPTVVVLIAGRVLALPWIAEHVPALLCAWPPGEEGGSALADVLFGAACPSGRLPVTIPRHVGQVPIHHARRWVLAVGVGPFSSDYADGPAAPLFPFGHGLSYTRFEYADLAVAPEAAAPDAPIEIALTLANRGQRAGEEVVQLYVQDRVASVTRPVQQLAGFARVALEPGATRSLRFRLDPSQLAFYDRDMRFVVEPGEVAVRVGASSEDVRLEGRFRFEGDVRELSPRAVVPTSVEISG